MEESGVYRLTVGDLYYIGSSTHLAGRYRSHLKALIEGTQANYRLQAEYTRAGTTEFSGLEQCQWSDVRVVEQRYLDEHYGQDECANINRLAVDESRPARRLRPPPGQRRGQRAK